MDSKARERYEKGRGRGANVHIGIELIEVIERFKDAGNYATIGEASSELGKLLQKHNLILREPDQQEPLDARQEEESGEESGWGGKYASMSPD